jgi:hypothetical protein
MHGGAYCLAPTFPENAAGYSARDSRPRHSSQYVGMCMARHVGLSGFVSAWPCPVKPFSSKKEGMCTSLIDLAACGREGWALEVSHIYSIHEDL